MKRFLQIMLVMLVGIPGLSHLDYKVRNVQTLKLDQIVLISELEELRPVVREWVESLPQNAYTPKAEFVVEFVREGVPATKPFFHNAADGADKDIIQKLFGKGVYRLKRYGNNYGAELLLLSELERAGAVFNITEEEIKNLLPVKGAAPSAKRFLSYVSRLEKLVQLNVKELEEDVKSMRRMDEFNLVYLEIKSRLKFSQKGLESFRKEKAKKAVKDGLINYHYARVESKRRWLWNNGFNEYLGGNYRERAKTDILF